MHLVFLTPSPDPAGGGRAFNAGLIPALRDAGHDVTVQHDTHDMPGGAIPVIDGLLLPDLEPSLDALLTRDAVVLVHHVGARAGRDPAARDAVRATEHRMMPAFRRVVATSATVAERLVADFAVPTPAVLAPGFPALPRSLGSPGPSCAILSLGVLTPRKGADRLLQALARLTDLDWTLVIAGDAQRDPVHAAAIAALPETLRLQSRVTILPDPTPEALETAWRNADLFASASSWEGFPAAIAEALRRGIPIVGTTVGGVPALVPMSAGILAAPDDPATFGKCMRRAIFDDSLRRALANGAWQAGLALPGWPQQALAFEAILRS